MTLKRRENGQGRAIWTGKNETADERGCTQMGMSPSFSGLTLPPSYSTLSSKEMPRSQPIASWCFASEAKASIQRHLAPRRTNAFADFCRYTLTTLPASERG